MHYEHITTVKFFYYLRAQHNNNVSTLTSCIFQV